MKHILVVNRTLIERDMIMGLLAQDFFACCAADCTEGLAILARDKQKSIDIIVLDECTNELSQRDFIKGVVGIRPDVCVLLLGDDPAALVEVSKVLLSAHVKKPVNVETFLSTLHMLAKGCRSSTLH